MDTKVPIEPSKRNAATAQAPCNQSGPIQLVGVPYFTESRFVNAPHKLWGILACIISPSLHAQYIFLAVDTSNPLLLRNASRDFIFARSFSIVLLAQDIAKGPASLLNLYNNRLYQP
jgi:hypothetical protein